MPEDKKKPAPLLSVERHQLAAERQTLQMNRDLLDPPKNAEIDAAKKAELAEIDRKIAEIDKQLNA